MSEVLDPLAGASAAAPEAPPAGPAPKGGGAPITMYDSTGAAHEVPSTEAPRLLLGGGAFFAKGQTVHVRDDRGHIYALKPEEAGQAFAAGMQVASPEEVSAAVERKEQNTIGKSLEAGAIGVGRGITLGLSDPLAIGAAQAFGGEESAKATREHLAKLKEHHPIASTVGEVAGAVAPVLLSGGAGAAAEGAEAGLGIGSVVRGAGVLPRAAARLGEGAGALARGVVGEGAEGLAGRVLQRAIPLAVHAGTEGAIYGAGSTISEAALGDEDLTAEKLLAGAGHGAMLGAVTGGALGAGYEVGKAALDRGLKLVGKEGLQSWLQSVADSQTIKALGANARDVKNLGGVARSAGKAEERVGEIAETVRNYHFEDGQRLFKANSTTSQLADDLPRAVDEAGQKLGQFRARVADLTRTNAELAPDTIGFLNKLDAEVVQPMKAAGGSLANRAKLVSSEFNTLMERATSAEPVTIEELTNVRKNLDRILYPKRVMGVQAPPAEHYAELLQARQMLEQTIESTTEKALAATGNGELNGSYQALKATFKDLADAKAMATAADMRALTRNTVSLSDKMAVGAALAGNIGGLPGAAAAGIANRLANTYGNAFTAAVAQKASMIVGLQRAAGHVDAHMGEAITAFLSDQHEAGELAEKLGHVTRETTKTAVEKAKKYGGTREAPTIGKREPATPAGRYEAVTSHLQQMADPAAAAERVSQHVDPVAQHAPRVGAAMASKVTNAAAYLATKQPRPHIEEQYPGYTASAKPNDVERAEFLRRVDGTQPEKVMTHVKQLRASPEEIETFKQTAPKLYADTAQKMVEGIAEKTQAGKVIPYDKMVQASSFLGKPMHPTLEPAFIAAVQQMHAEKAGASSQSAQSAAGAPKRQLKFAGGNASQSSRIAGGDR
jgi:hypothetical protein